MIHWHFAPDLHPLVSVWYLQPTFSNSRDQTSLDPDVSSKQQKHNHTAVRRLTQKLHIHNEGFVGKTPICVFLILFFLKWGFNCGFIYFFSPGSNCFTDMVLFSLPLLWEYFATNRDLSLCALLKQLASLNWWAAWVSKTNWSCKMEPVSGLWVPVAVSAPAVCSNANFYCVPTHG